MLGSSLACTGSPEAVFMGPLIISHEVKITYKLLLETFEYHELVRSAVCTLVMINVYPCNFIPSQS